MTPEEMAQTGAWTQAAYDRMLGHINNIKDRATRDLVLEMVLRPESKIFKAALSYLASPPAGGRGHHYYPGGLPVHALEWIEVAMGWADAYEKIYKVKKVDPHWDLDRDGEGLNPALAEAAKLAGKPPIVVQPGRRMLEWWFSTYTDGSWSFSHYVAGFTGIDAVEAVAKDLGVAPGSLEANKLAWFVLSRVSDDRIYEAYQQAGFKLEAAKDLVLAILRDSAAYEVPKR